MARDQNQEGAPQAGWELQWRDREATPDEGYQAYPGANLLEERDRQRRQLGGKLRKIDRDIEASEGYRMRARMNLLEKSYFIFDTNYLNLGHVLDRFDLFIDDVIRLFHNYLAGALTLLDHMDTLRDTLYGDEGFSEEYQARWEERIGGPALPHFMEDLLVYMLHQGLPFALAELNFGSMGSGVEVDSAIRLDVDRFKDWEHWSEKGREYLGALSGKAKLHGLVKEYADTVAGFYQWFVLRQSELHRDSLERFEELEEKSREQWQKMRRIEDFLETAESTATEARKDRERLSKELERERERAERLEADLDRERSKGFWRRVFGR